MFDRRRIRRRPTPFSSISCPSFQHKKLALMVGIVAFCILGGGGVTPGLAYPQPFTYSDMYDDDNYDNNNNNAPSPTTASTSTILLAFLLGFSSCFGIFICLGFWLFCPVTRNRDPGVVPIPSLHPRVRRRLQGYRAFLDE